MDDLDIYRAAWFRASLRFLDHGLAERKALWLSWSSWCDVAGVDYGSKTRLYSWLLDIGARPHGKLLRRIKLL
jgi:hypothetical protein